MFLALVMGHILFVSCLSGCQLLLNSKFVQTGIRDVSNLQIKANDREIIIGTDYFFE